MSPSAMPFNIDLLIPTHDMLKDIEPIKVLDIFAGSTRNFHPEGLFSTEIFGKMGDERRNRRFSYIDLRIKVFHPVIFKAYCDLKQLYGEIIAGGAFATWNEEKKDFERSTPSVGETGYSFFLKHYKEIQFDNRNSDKRDFNIRLVQKYIDNNMIDKLIVMPAGLRDYEYDENGKPSEGEINPIYRQVFSYANLISPAAMKINPESMDNTRYNLQLKVNTVYDFIKSLLEGKHKLILGKFAARRIYNGSRNVITSLNNDSDHLESPTRVDVNQTVMGLYQYLKATLPVAIHHLRNGFLSKVFVGHNAPAYLVNKKTLKKEIVHIDPKYYDEWMTSEGLEKIITRFGEEDLRHMYLQINNHYIGLIYKGGNVYKLFQDIDELPEKYDRKDVYPVTFAELLYLSVYQDSHTFPCFVTRYPVIEYGSTYPSYVYLKTTVKGEVRTELGEDWEPTKNQALNFPIKDAQFMNSMCPSPAHLASMGADFDGDMCSANIVFSDEAKAEVSKILNSKKFYVDTNNRMPFSANTDTIDYVLASITG